MSELNDKLQEKVLTLQVQTLLTQHSIIEVLIEMADFFERDENFVQSSTKKDKRHDDYMDGVRESAIMELTLCWKHIEGS